jgi:hypothetical protein
MISCPGLLTNTEMAQRSNRRFLNLISVEVFQTVTLIRKRAGGIHHGQESLTPPKAEYIGADRTTIPQFSFAILRRTIHTDNVYDSIRCAPAVNTARRTKVLAGALRIECVELSRTGIYGD